MGKETKHVLSEAETAFCNLVQFCAANDELVEQFNRLSGLHMGERRTPIQIAIDQACGYDPDAVALPKFAQFVFDYIWKPLENGYCRV